MDDQTPGSRDVLLIGADLIERRLLFGELLEAGYDVLPLPGVASALGTLLSRAVAPRLILLDVQGDEHATPGSVAKVATLCPRVPLVVLVGSIDKELWEPLEGRVAVLLHRPITIGQLVATIQRMLPAGSPDQPHSS